MNKSYTPQSTNIAERREQYIKGWFQEGDKRLDGRVIQDIFSTLFSYRWSILLLFIIGCVVGALKAINEDPIYQANLTMAVEPNTFKASNQYQTFTPYAMRFYETQYEMLRSRTVAESVVDTLGLVERDNLRSILVPPSFNHKLMATLSRLPLMNHFFAEPVLTVEEMDKQVFTDAERENKRRWLTGVVKSGVMVKGTKQSQLVQVSFNSRDPEFAAEIANALVEAYINNGIESQITRSQKTSGWIVDRLEQVKKDLASSELKLQSYLKNNRSVDLAQSRAISTQQLSSLSNEYIQARARYDELSKRYGERHPRIAAARAERNSAKARYDSAARGVGSSKGNEFKLSKLEREVELNQKLYELFSSKFKESDLNSGGDQISSARIVDVALPPRAPIYPNKRKIMLMWGMGGLLLGVVLSFLREQLDTTFKGPLQLESEIGLPLLGVVPKVMRKSAQVEREYLKNSTSAFSESINHIRTGVLYSDIDNPPQVVLMTSSLQSEGKTTTSSNLAISLAQMGKTLLIDADLRRPRVKHITKNQHTDDTFGLVDLVMGRVSLADCIINDNESQNLSLILAGDPPPNPLELLSSERMKKVVEVLRGEFEYIVIDAAPILPASDAIVLGQIADATLMVVQAESTSSHMVKDAVKRLNSAQVPVTGVVLTQADVARMKSYKYGGYYGAYYRNEDVKS